MLDFVFGNSEQIKSIVIGCLTELSRRFPPTMVTGESRKLSPQAVTNILESVIGKLVTKSQQIHLGWVGKAKLANELKWALKDKGYPEKFTDVFIEAVIVYVTRKQSSTEK